MHVPNHRRYCVFVPTDASAGRFDPRSAIVAPDAAIASDGFVVWLESNRYSMDNLSRFIERVHHAAGRADQHYPTIAKCRVTPADVIEVAHYDLPNGLLTPTNRPALARWLDGEPVERCFDQQALEWAEVFRARGHAQVPDLMARHIPPLVFARARAYLAMFAERGAPVAADVGAPC